MAMIQVNDEGKWTPDELTSIGNAEELEISSRRNDGSLRNPVTIWVVRHGDDLYVRSVKGRTGGWFRGTRSSGEGHIAAGGVERDVAFLDADHHIDDELDAAYRAKYRRYGSTIVGSIISRDARSSTIRLMPRQGEQG
jgi:hypothetical protein